jgi:YesN/AraC family two-component response regulator
LVITDLRMPHVTGDELIKQLRAQHYAAKFCIMSGGFESLYAPLAQVARVFGADAALPKPVHMALLEATIRMLTDTGLDRSVP